MAIIHNHKKKDSQTSDKQPLNLLFLTLRIYIFPLSIEPLGMPTGISIFASYNAKDSTNKHNAS